MIQIHSTFYFVLCAGLFLILRFFRPAQLHRAAFLALANFFMAGTLLIFEKKHFAFLCFFIISSFFLTRLIERFPKHKIFFLIAQICYVFVYLLTFHSIHFQDFILRTLDSETIYLLSPLHFIGVSFFCFRIMSVSFDAFYGRIDSLKLTKYIAFVSFFPTFLSGPLSRMQDFRNDLARPYSITTEQLYNSIYRIVLGLFKKKVLANALFPLCLDSMHMESAVNLRSWQILAGLYIYVVVLYLDFSGYCDAAIGVAQLFGIRTPENFKSPWKARNLQELWNSWHITLFEWLRDYIYNPAAYALIRLGSKNLVINSIIASYLIFAIAGVWHGDQWNFLLYGLYHGTAAMFFILYRNFVYYKLPQDKRKAYMASAMIRVCANFITLNYFIFGLLIFIGKQTLLIHLLKRLVGLNAVS